MLADGEAGEGRPKQFCSLFGGKTLLTHTRARLERAINPARTAFVVLKAHEKLYRQELADVDRLRLIVQPSNKGTTAAVVSSLLRITMASDNPVVAFFPADHHYSNAARFVASVHRAVRVAQHHSDSLVLLGARAEHAEVDYCWIQPGGLFNSPLTNTLLRVNRLWQNPPVSVAQMLLARGGLWNTSVTIGRASLFLSLLANTLSPWAWRVFLAAQSEPDPEVAHDKLWPLLAPGDFSRQVLSANTGSIAVLRVGDIGWSDLRTPERVREVLARSGFGLQQQTDHEHSDDLVRASSR